MQPLDQLTNQSVRVYLLELIRDMEEAEQFYTPVLSGLHDNFRLSGSNLVHYMVLRANEIRATQEFLHRAGLSSLANSESHTLSQLISVLQFLEKEKITTTAQACDYAKASGLMQQHAEQLLGEFPSMDRPHIMVTFSADLLHDHVLMEDMLNEGMTIARINCAHDNEETWSELIRLLRRAIAKTGRSCKIYMDLAGPKIRIHHISAKRKENEAKLPIEEGKEIMICPVTVTGNPKVVKSEHKKLDVLFAEPGDIISMIKTGEHIFFDDGKFEARVVESNSDYLVVRIVRISTKKPILKPEKGINLPDSDVTIAPLTAEDIRNIPFICRHADMVGYSFVNSPDDIEILREELRKQPGTNKPAIILKIERLAAVQHLPSLLMNGMKDDRMGVMIARGDLAVEIGFERLSEIQEEILWICEAAHVPVIWATQVLETLNKTGFATRSEITDAAMGVRAECVMLNKGKFIVKTIRTLADILHRQVGHVHKKRYIMRPLGIAKDFIQRD